MAQYVFIIFILFQLDLTYCSVSTGKCAANVYFCELILHESSNLSCIPQWNVIAGMWYFVFNMIVLMKTQIWLVLFEIKPSATLMETFVLFKSINLYCKLKSTVGLYIWQEFSVFLFFYDFVFIFLSREIDGSAVLEMNVHSTPA